jgi:hypothetical protein
MTITTYTFHRAYDHAILATAEPRNLQTVAATIATAISRENDTGASRRVYIHNGRGVIGAGLCRAGRWTDILRDDYRQFDAKARTVRDAAGYANDQQKGA